MTDQENVNITELERLKRELAEAKKEQQSFIANISHEIRTPLNGIIGMAELLLNQHLPAKHEKYVRTIYRSSETLLALINDLLDLSALEQGNLKIEKIPCSIPDILQEVILLFSAEALEKGIALRLYCPPGLPNTVLSDPVRLKEILLSLVENAIKFTKKGEVILGVIPDPLEFFVSDTGVGIPTEVQGRIFERFVQSNEATRKYTGMGLDLSVARLLVERMGGEIGFKSREGKGSLFFFTLPFEVVPTPPLLSDAARKCFQGKRVLIITSSDFKQFNYSIIFRWAGLYPVIAHGAEEGLEILERDRFSRAGFDFILFCREDEDKNWIETILAIEQEARLHGAPVILNDWLKWWNDHVIDEKAIPCHFLPKPTLPSEVFKLLTELVTLPKVKKS